MRFGSLVAALALLTALPAAAQVAPGNVGSWPFLANALTNTAVKVKGTQGIVDTVSCANTNAAIGFIQMFDVASATSVTVGTTVPVFSLPVSPSIAFHASIPLGINFENGIKIAATTGIKNGTALGTALDCSIAFR